MRCPKCATENPDGASFCRGCGQSLQTELVCSRCQHVNLADSKFCNNCGNPLISEIGARPTPSQLPTTQPAPSSLPTSFASGRYQVKKFLGEGGKKKVYLAHDTVLDRDVAFALIKTEKLDAAARTRIKREAQAMGRLGDHPNIVTVFDFGDHEGQPYMVLPLLSGGDVEALIKKAQDHKLPIDQAVEISKSVCRGLGFAHAKGIIHRDIKPGNVWMSADGTAKVGDFGLAVAVDLSRLTQAGMMVGTVSYMPPEQAMGGKVTAKADLYSLGAMLYEMVTGRPPFVGADSVAIIGQHINTPPVSPSWHRADLPPSLETLIMQLLEKDPEKRPESATVVLQALETISTGKTKQEPSKEAKAEVENPLYRRVFVGREQELKQLQSAFDGAMSGQGALMMVLGEPGIGKTALCEQLSTYVTLRGGRTLVGHCYEEGSLSLPYLAFVEAMRSYVLDRDANDLRKELGSGASDIARIVSEVREKLDIKPRAGENPEEERYRLLQAVTSFVTHAASVRPILVVLEDLHDADKGTLDMLTYVSRNLSGARLLVVGTYRDVEVDRAHPLSAALAELRRVSTFGRVLLRGLNADEVRRMLNSMAHEEVPWGLAQAIHRQTEGNPLFVQEVVRFLIEQKLLVRADGKMAASGLTPVEMNIPEGLRDVIGKRLSNLSQGCNRLLSIAAVIGREFRLDVLQKVFGLSEEEVFASIEEAKKVAVVEERPGLGAVVTYRFAHAFFRTILYEEIIAPRRIRLHQQVARALEQVFASRLREHAAELAEHFSYSTEPGDLRKSVSYGEMAAQRASDVYNYGEAARLLQRALKVQEVLDPDDKGKQCDLLIALGSALMFTGEYRHAVEKDFTEALLLAEQIGDDDRAARASYRAAIALGYGGTETWAGQEMLLWAEKADHYAKPNTLERAWADCAMANTKVLGGLLGEAGPLLERSFEQARSFGDKDLLEGAGSLLLVCMRPWSDETKLIRIAEEVGSTTARMGRFAAFGAFLNFGIRKQAEEVAQSQKQHAAMTGQGIHIGLGLMMEAMLASIDGRLEESVNMADHLVSYARQMGLSAYFNILVHCCALRPIVYLGNVGDRGESELWKVLREGLDSPLNVSALALVAAYLGRVEETNQRLDRMLASRPKITSKEDVTLDWMDIAYLESAVLIGHRRAAESVLQRFAGTTLKTTGYQWTTCIRRHLGAAAALLGRGEEAREHYQGAIKVCTEMRFRPDLALTRLQLAELLLDHFPVERKDALEHLDFAIKEFREMKMQPSLERALRRKDILKA